MLSAMTMRPGMLGDVVLWWARQMRSLLPPRLSTHARRADALLVALRSAHAMLTLRRRGRESPLGQFAANQDGLTAAAATLRSRPRHVVLRLDTELLLERTVDLPLAAERELDRVIGFEMDRLTPFTASDVVWQATVARRDHARRRIRIRLSLIPRRTIQPWLDLLKRTGLAPDWLEANAADGTPRRLALGDKTTRQSRIGLTAAAVVIAVLALAVVVTPFAMQAIARASTERRIDALAPRVARVEAMRKRLAEGAAGVDALAAERAKTGDVLQILAAVTDIVPDDTWLTDLSLHQGKLGINGQSPAAARLIPALAADPSFRNPAFAAPVTRAPDGHADLFAIRAELAP